MLISFYHPRVGLPPCLFPFSSTTNIQYSFLTVPIRDTRLAHPTASYLIVSLTSGEQYKLPSYAIFSNLFSLIPLTSNYSPKNSVLKHSRCSTLNVTDKDLQPRKTTGRLHSICIQANYSRKVVGTYNIL